MNAPLKLMLLALLATPATPQRLYNATQDQQATAALEAARALAAASQFDKAIANLAELQKLANEDIFRSARILMKSEMATWRSWDDLDASLRRFEAALTEGIEGGDDFQAELAKAKQSEGEARQELAELAKMLSADPTMANFNATGSWLDRIAKVGQVSEFLIRLEGEPAAGGPNMKAAKQAKSSLDRLAVLFKSFRLDLPNSPSKLFLQSQVEALELEVQHQENLIAIQSRLERELKDIRSILKQSRAGIGFYKPIFGTLSLQECLDKQAAAVKAASAANKAEETGKLSDMLFLFHNTAALASRNHTPLRLAEYRESLEQRAHSLRQAGATADAYQDLIINGLQRLSLYYKGGLRPNTLADLIQAFATAGILPAILTK